MKIEINSEKIKEFVQSKVFRKILCGLGVIVIALLILQVGILVGYHKASYSYRYGDNYHKTFGGARGELGDLNKRGGMMGFLRGGDFSNSYGVTGKIIKIDLPTMVVIGQDGIEKVITISDDTTIMHLRDKVRASNLNINDSVVVIGSPNDDSQIEAKLIRIMPTSQSMKTGTTTPGN